MRNQAMQVTADRFAELKACLLGPTKQGLRPSQRARLIQLGLPEPAAMSDEDAPWPSRCLPYARDVDASLAAASVRERLGPLPSAEGLIDEGNIFGPELDSMFVAIAALDLPAARDAETVPRAPPSVMTLLDGRALVPFGELSTERDVTVDFDARHGRVLRLLARESGATMLCKLNDGPREERWQTASCKATSLPPTPEVRLAKSEPDAADLAYRGEPEDDGFFDVASGLRMWRPRDPSAQALVGADGTTTIFYASRDGDGAPEHRLVRLAPGKAPESRRPPFHRRARALLLGEAIVWWQPAQGDDGGRDAVYTTPLAEPKTLRNATPVGYVPHGSEHLADCTSGYVQALLFGSKGGAEHGRLTLLLRERDMFSRVIDVAGVAPEDRAHLSCHQDAAVLAWERDHRVWSLRCSVEGCRRASSQPTAALARPLHAATAVSHRIALLHADRGGPLRLRVGRADQLHESADKIVVDDERHGGLALRGLSLWSSDGLALAMLLAADGKAYLVRIDDEGHATAVRVAR